MGNNAAYATFEHTIITLYDKGVLDLDLLDILACEYEGMDVDSGGSQDLQSRDGKSLEQVCIELVDPDWKPERRPEDEDDEWWESGARYDKFMAIRRGRWGW